MSNQNTTKFNESGQKIKRNPSMMSELSLFRDIQNSTDLSPEKRLHRESIAPSFHEQSMKLRR